MNAYEQVTASIIAQLDNGIIPWAKPYSGVQGACNYISRRAYSLLNRMLLPKGGEWLTPRQAMEAKADFTGARTSTVYFFKMQERRTKVTDPDTGEEKTVKETFPVLKSYNVLHVSDCKGLESKMEAPLADEMPDFGAQLLADRFCIRTGVSVEHGVYDTPSYDAATDTVHMPHRGQYTGNGAYYADLFRCLALATGTRTRLDRGVEGELGTEGFGREQLLAEMASCIVLNELEMQPSDILGNSIAYMQGWKAALGADSHALVWCASRAEKAAAMILGTDADAKAA